MTSLFSNSGGGAFAPLRPPEYTHEPHVCQSTTEMNSKYPSPTAPIGGGATYTLSWATVYISKQNAATDQDIIIFSDISKYTLHLLHLLFISKLEIYHFYQISVNSEICSANSSSTYTHVVFWQSLSMLYGNSL